MQAVVDDFNQSQDRIFVKKLSISGIDQKLMLAVSGGNPPDVAGLWSYALPVYAEKGALRPLDAAMGAAGIHKDDYLPVIWDLCQHRGYTWALPTTPACVALHWNATLFRQAGLDPDRAPQTLDELDRFAEQLTIVELTRDGKRQQVRFTDLTPAEKSAKAFDIISLGYSPAEPGWWNSMWGYWFDGQLWDSHGKLTPCDPGNIKAYEWFASYPAKYGVDNLRRFSASAGNFSSAQNPFLAGKVAMVLQGVWMQNFIAKYAPDMQWRAAPFPTLSAGGPPVTIVETDVLVIPHGSRHPREAFEFMRYVNRQDVIEKLELGQHKFSPLRQVSPDFSQRHPNPYIGIFSDLARSSGAHYAPRLALWNEYQDELNAAADRIFSCRQSPLDALRAVERRMEPRYQRAERRWQRSGQERLREWQHVVE